MKDKVSYYKVDTEDLPKYIEKDNVSVTITNIKSFNEKLVMNDCDFPDGVELKPSDKLLELVRKIKNVRKLDLEEKNAIINHGDSALFGVINYGILLDDFYVSNE